MSILTKALAPLRLRWEAWSGRYAAMSRRERVLIAVAILAVLGLGGDALFLSSARQRAAKLSARLAEQSAAAVQLQAQVDQLQNNMPDPDAANRTELESVRNELAQLQVRLRDLDGSLVPPQRAAALLENLVRTQRGLTLVSLKTLAPAPLVGRASTKGNDAADKKAGDATVDGLPNVFRHGVELKVAGSYADLQAYVARLEATPQKLLWGRLDLQVDRYPRSTMTLTVYTLSLDPAWLAL